MILNKYLAALLNIVGVALAAIVAAQKVGPLDIGADDQIVILVIGAIVIYFVPLLNTKWAGLLKVLAAALTAAATAAYPAFVSHVQVDWLVVALAVLNALGVGVGTAVRSDSLKLHGPNLEVGSAFRP